MFYVFGYKKVFRTNRFRCVWILIKCALDWQRLIKISASFYLKAILQIFKSINCYEQKAGPSLHTRVSSIFFLTTQKIHYSENNLQDFFGDKEYNYQNTLTVTPVKGKQYMFKETDYCTYLSTEFHRSVNDETINDGKRKHVCT